MDTKLFKKIVTDTLIENGFAKKGAYYYRDGEDCVCIIGIQKSSFSEGFYVNVGFVLKKLHDSTDNLKDRDGDVRTRFTYISEGRKIDFFDMEKLSDSDGPAVKENIIRNINDTVTPALKPDGVRMLLSERPVLLYQTTGNAKEFLGIGIS